MNRQRRIICFWALIRQTTLRYSFQHETKLSSLFLISRSFIILVSFCSSLVYFLYFSFLIFLSNSHIFFLFPSFFFSFLLFSSLSFFFLSLSFFFLLFLLFSSLSFFFLLFPSLFVYLSFVFNFA